MLVCAAGQCCSSGVRRHRRVAAILPGVVHRAVPGARRDSPAGALPILSVVREHIGRNTSSSSSRLWILGTGPLPAGRPPNRPVGPLWAGRRLPVSTRGQLDSCAPTTARLHPPSPGHAQVRPHPPVDGPPEAAVVHRLFHRCGRRPSVGASTQVSGLWTTRTTGGHGGEPPCGQRRRRSPQPVHSPGDKATRPRRSRVVRTVTARRSGDRPRCRGPPRACERWGAPRSFYWRARLLIRAVSSVTWV